MTKYSYAIFFVDRSRLGGTTPKTRSREGVLRQLSSRCSQRTRPEEERAFPSATSARGCVGRHGSGHFVVERAHAHAGAGTPPPGVRRARPSRQPARIRFRFRHSPLTKPRPVPRAASRRDHHPGNARRRPRAPQGSERCPRGPVAEHARGTRSPRRPRGDGPADPHLDTRDTRDETKRASTPRRTMR